MFNHNEASQGGAIFTMSNIVFKENSTAKFDGNKALLGGALHTSNLTFKENTAVAFNNNKATLSGGALYSNHSSIVMKQKSTIIFIQNSAENGGAVFTSVATLLISEFSNVTFNKNTARQDGGAIHFNDLINIIFKNLSAVMFMSNIADNYGGAFTVKFHKIQSISISVKLTSVTIQLE